MAQGRPSVLDLSDKTCRFPIGHPDEADFHFCGKPAVKGFPYCAEHCAVAYESRETRAQRSKAFRGPMPPPGRAR